MWILHLTCFALAIPISTEIHSHNFECSVKFYSSHWLELLSKLHIHDSKWNSWKKHKITKLEFFYQKLFQTFKIFKSPSRNLAIETYEDSNINFSLFFVLLDCVESRESTPNFKQYSAYNSLKPLKPEVGSFINLKNPLQRCMKRYKV